MPRPPWGWRSHELTGGGDITAGAQLFEEALALAPDNPKACSTEASLLRCAASARSRVRAGRHSRFASAPDRADARSRIAELGLRGTAPRGQRGERGDGGDECVVFGDEHVGRA